VSRALVVPVRGLRRPRGCHLDRPRIPATERRVDDERYHSAWPVRPAELKAGLSSVLPAGSPSQCHAASTNACECVLALCLRTEGLVDDLELSPTLGRPLFFPARFFPLFVDSAGLVRAATCITVIGVLSATRGLLLQREPVSSCPYEGSTRRIGKID
jgi:hypothetical protein